MFSYTERTRLYTDLARALAYYQAGKLEDAQRCSVEAFHDLPAELSHAIEKHLQGAQEW